MSQSTVKHMSADAEDKFEAKLEGEDFGSIGDWEMELGLKIIKIEKAMEQAKASNPIVCKMLAKKLFTFNLALRFIDDNPKAASQIGSKGGLQSVISYFTKQAMEDAAKLETKKYSDQLIEYLPGVRLSKATGSVFTSAASSSGMKNP